MRIRNVRLARMVNSARGGRANVNLARRMRYQTQPKAPVFRVKNVRSGKVSFHFVVAMSTPVAVRVLLGSSVLVEVVSAHGVLLIPA